MTEELTDADVSAACDAMLQLVKTMPRDTDFERLQMASGALIGCALNPSVSAMAFARALTRLLVDAGQVVDVHVRGQAETIVFEGNSGLTRTLRMVEGEMIEVGETADTLN